MAAGTVSVEQRLELLSKLAANVDWNSLDPSGIQSIINKPGGPGRQFTEFLRNGGRVTIELKAFPTWKTIKLGTGLQMAGDFHRAIMDARMSIYEQAVNMLYTLAFSASKTEQEIDLVMVTPKELGLNGDASYKDICDKAIESGLDRCPVEAGPQLRLQYFDQPNGERVTVATKPITGSRGGFYVFSVERERGGLRLSTRCSDPDCVWGAYSRFVFCRRYVVLGHLDTGIL